MSKKAQSKSYKGDLNLIMLAALAVLVVGVFGISLYKTKLNQTVVAEPKIVTVALNAVNKSGEEGVATLKEVGGNVIVSINLTGAPKGVTQPAHIHEGECPGVGGVKYALTFPVDGKSETTLDTSLEKLQAQGKLAINIHKSVPLAKTYVACGEISF